KLGRIFQTRRRQTDLKSGEGCFSRRFPPLFQTCRSEDETRYCNLKRRGCLGWSARDHDPDMPCSGQRCKLAGSFCPHAFLRLAGGADLPTVFLHLDFMPDNRVRIDDDPGTLFGTFPRDQVFIVQVTLNIDASAATAHTVLSGAGASGQADYTIISALRPVARQFGAI